jgi:uncharacterized protein YndB with AHSA1/START domain/DNA-binding transcriptional ArsR family regulator
MVFVSSEDVFRALADAGRRRLLDMLHERSGQTLGELCEDMDMRRQSVSQHLDVLEVAGLVTSVRDGRRKLHYLNPVPIHDIQRRWIWKFEAPRLATIDAIKQRAEEYAMNESGPETIPDFVYTTYIRATADQVWEALTSAELSARFWGHSQVSDWHVGSRVDHVRVDGSGVADASGTVIEVDRPRRLVFGFDAPDRLDDPLFEPSVVTFDIEPGRDIVRLTVTHASLATMGDRENIADGWAAVLANLKTLLETGDVLPEEPWGLQADNRDDVLTESD